MEKGILAAQAVMEARELLAVVTPLRRDCGRLCGAKCCRPDEDGCGGMLLFPGEEACYETLPPGFQLHRDDSAIQGGTLLTCGGTCYRDTRPLACRVFPLAFTLKEGRAGVALDPRAWPVCPLMAEGLAGLSGDFVAACQQAAEVLAAQPAQAAFILAQQRLMEAFTQQPWEEGGKA